MKKVTLLPRLVGFNEYGIAIGAGTSYLVDRAPIKKVMELPSSHYDFIDFDVRGKTKSEIESEVSDYINSLKESE